MGNIITKKCSECGKEKPVSDFYKSKESRSGLRYQCKQCDKLRAKKWYSVPENAKAAISRVLKWKKDNPESNRRLALEYQSKNFPKVYKRIRAWRKEHPESNQVAKANRRAREKLLKGKISRQEWENLKKKYNFTCLRCKKREPEIKLTLDHVVPISRGGDNAIHNVQPLCISCNCKKNAKTIDYR